MRCAVCDGETRPKKVRKQHWLKGKLYIVENVEAEVCMQCGERYFHARVLDNVDAVISGDHAVSEILSVEVLSV